MTRHRLSIAVFLLWGILGAAGCSSEPAAPAPAPPPQEKKVEVGVTPWGIITKIETANSWNEKGMDKRLRAEPGYQLWVLHIAPNPAERDTPPDPTPPSFEVMSRINVKESSLVDASGERHCFLWARLSVHMKPTDKPDEVTFEDELERIVYSMPRDRQPKALRLGDGTEVPLPNQ